MCVIYFFYYFSKKLIHMKTIIVTFLLSFGIITMYGGNNPEKSNSVLKSSFKLNYSPLKKKAQSLDEKGFYFNIGLSMPSKNCYVSLDTSNSSSDKYKSGISLELGNSFHIANIENNAIGIRVSWLKATYNTFSKTYSLGGTSTTFNSNYLQGSILRIGPYFSYDLRNDMVVEAFYQFGPTYCYDVKDTAIVPGFVSTNVGFFGITHNIGVDFRYQKFYGGFDLNFGNVKYLAKDVIKNKLQYSDKDFHDEFTLRTSYFRLFIGIHL
jgi:hypothetical protein